jgi:hypothetical protein
MDRKNPLQPIDNNNHSVNEQVFGQSVGPAINIDLLKNKERTKSKHKPKSKQKETKKTTIRKRYLFRI